MRILKFGGSSLATPARVRAATAIVLEASRRERTVVVVSAFAGVTDALIDAAGRAERDDAGYTRSLAALARRHRRILRALF